MSNGNLIKGRLSKDDKQKFILIPKFEKILFKKPLFKKFQSKLSYTMFEILSLTKAKEHFNNFFGQFHTLKCDFRNLSSF